MAFYDFLNFIFAPLLKLPPALSIVLMAFFISLLIIIITKYTTDQALMKRLKDEIKEHQNEIKRLKDNPAKAMEVQKKSMEINMKYMMHSLRPTIITFIPIILIFGWMSSVFAYESIKPQQQFQITAYFDSSAGGYANLKVPEGVNLVGNASQQIENGAAAWTLKGAEGEHLLEIDYNGETLQQSVLITSTNRYIEPLKKTNGAIKSIQIGYKKLVVVPIGFRDWFGWLGTYIWSSILFTMGLRKLLKIY